MTDHAHTLLILTDAESRCVRRILEKMEAIGSGVIADECRSALRDFNRGITRGTEKMAAEFAAAQKAKRK